MKKDKIKRKGKSLETQPDQCSVFGPKKKP
jgi:hypothetical protein